MGSRARLLALLIIFFMMSLAMGAFCNAISGLFVDFNPDAIIPSFGLMVVAVAVGVSVYKFKLPLGITTVAALVVFGGLILWGVEQPVCTYQWFVKPETRAALDDGATAPNRLATCRRSRLPYGAVAAIAHLDAVGNEAAARDIERVLPATKLAWIGVLLLYGFLASVLPVWLLLQPRDYINSFQLYFALTTMLVGHDGRRDGRRAGKSHRGAPDSHERARAPGMFPFLFVTIACGAVSGFHSLVSSGTTVKQLNRETDALPIGYGAMLVEAALAILVILACAAGLGADVLGRGRNLFHLGRHRRRRAGDATERRGPRRGEFPRPIGNSPCLRPHVAGRHDRGLRLDHARLGHPPVAIQRRGDGPCLETAAGWPIATSPRPRPWRASPFSPWCPPAKRCGPFSAPPTNCWRA